MKSKRYFWLGLMAAGFFALTACGGGGGTKTEICNDGIDNTGNGLIDCADPDCENSPACQDKTEICDDGIDNTGNGLIDCADPDCENFSGCQQSEYCGDGECSGTEDPSNCPEDCGTCSNRCDSNGDTRFCGENGVELTLDCPDEYGSVCTGYGEGFYWCDCGTLSEGESLCYEDSSLNIASIECENGMLLFYIGVEGTYCDDSSGEALYYCDDADDGVCPDDQCVNDPDCSSCTPSCDGKECGPNGCGGTCSPGCSFDETCNAYGQCEASCVPDCTGRECGPDGCGGFCSSGCEGGETCNTSTGQCESGTCTPDCDGKVCSSDGCGSTCGTCPGTDECYTQGSYDYCGCEDFFSDVTYILNGSGLDWSDINYIAIEIKHNYSADGRPESMQYKEVVLDSTTPEDSVTFAGACDPNVDVIRTYSMSGGVICTLGPELVEGLTNLTIPQPTLDGGTCTAPSF